MKQYELKDLEPGKEYIVIYTDKNIWIPCRVNVSKYYIIKLIRPKTENFSPLEKNKEYSIKSFYNECRGIDLFGNKFTLLNCFDSFKEAENMCKYRNAC